MWDKYANAGATYQKWVEVGDQVVGTIKIIREAKDYNGNPVPELVLEDGNGGSLIVQASQVMLLAELVAAAPAEGDRIRITYTGNGEAKPGRTAPKLFTVEVKAGVKPVEGEEATQLEAPF